MNLFKKKHTSFIIPAYNCSKYLPDAIRSIFNGNFSVGDEVIIVDDASTDNTFKVAESLQKKYPAIHIFRHHYNKGSAAAGRNTGIDNSKNDLIFCLDADNILCPNSISKLKEFMISKRADAASFGELHFFERNSKNVINKWIYKKEITLHDVINNLEKTPCASGNYLFTKASWLRAGRYNESSFVVAYDSWAFGFHQLATGTKMITLPKSFYYHRCGYESTFVKERKKINPSHVILEIILPYLNLIDENDINYIMGEKERDVWFDNIRKHPIRFKKNDL